MVMLSIVLSHKSGFVNSLGLQLQNNDLRQSGELLYKGIGQLLLQIVGVSSVVSFI